MKPLSYTDEEIERALIKANGQPTKAAEILDCSYTNLWKRIRANPELLAVQKANRARVFNECSTIMEMVAKNGLMKYNKVDKDGGLEEGGIYVAVDERTRLSALQTMMNIFKGDDGVAEEVNINANITQKGTISIGKWISENNEDNGKNAGDI